MQITLTDEQALALREHLEWVDRSQGTAQCNSPQLQDILISLSKELAPKPYTVIFTGGAYVDDVRLMHIMIAGEPTMVKCTCAASDVFTEQMISDGADETDLDKLLDGFSVKLIFAGHLVAIASEIK